MISFLLIASEEGGFNPLDFTDLGVAFWTWVILLIAIPFIWKFVMNPVMKSMEDRDAKAVEAISSALKASAEAQNAKLEVEQRLAEARAMAQKTVEDAKRRAEARERELVQAAEKRAKDLEEAATRAIQTEKEKALAAIRDEVVDLSLRAASRVIERNVGSEDDKRLVREVFGQAKK